MEPLVACSSQHLEGRPSHFAGTFRGTDVGQVITICLTTTTRMRATHLACSPSRSVAVDLSAGVGMEWIVVPFPAISGAKHRLKPAQNACH